MPYFFSAAPNVGSQRYAYPPSFQPGVDMPRLRDLTGQKFERLDVIERRGKDIKGQILWLCRCDCGTEKIVAGTMITTGRTKSCGCFQRDMASAANITHGGSGTRLFSIWNGMRKRCGNPKEPGYKNYGSRGIRVCDEWLDFSAFRAWAHSHGYADDLTIERIKNSVGYQPGNCKWIPNSDQWKNTRRTQLSPEGDPWSIVAEHHGINNYTYRHRRFFRGWPAKRAATEPLNRKQYSRDFKRKAVARLVAGESANTLAIELLITAAMIYKWRNANH